MNIIKLAFGVSAAVEKFLTKAKQFYYLVMLFGYHCPKCNGSLAMIAEGRCRCNAKCDLLALSGVKVESLEAFQV